MEKSVTVRVRVHGLVQGVGFRYWTLRNARRLDLTGYVRNMPDGSVEALLHGEGSSVAEMRELMKTGPGYACVERLESLPVNTSPAESCSVFSILR